MAEKRLHESQIPLLPGVANARGLKLLGAATTPSSLGATGGPIDIPGLTFTINVDIPQQVIVIISCQGIQTETTASANSLFYSIDGTDYTGISNVIGGAVVNAFGPATSARVHFMTAGPHVIKGRADNPGGPNRVIHGPIHLMVFGTDSDLGGGGGEQSAGGASALVRAQAELSSGGPFTNSSLSYADVPSALVSFTLTEPKVVLFIGEAYAFRDDANGGRQNTQIGINIDGTDFNGGSVDTDTLGGFASSGLVVHKSALLSAGPHTARLRFRRHQAGNSANAILLCNSTYTVRLTALYTEPVFGVGSLTKVEGENATGTASANSTLTYAVIPNTSISFHLETEKTVLFEGFATAFHPYTGANVQLGVRVDGTDYHGSSVLGSGNEERTVIVHKALALSAGPHSASLVFRKGQVGSDAHVRNGTSKPTRLTAIWTAPSSSSLLLAKSFVDTTSGDFTTSAAYPGTHIPGATVSFQQSVIGDIIVHVDAQVNTSTIAPIPESAIGVQLDSGTVVRLNGYGQIPSAGGGTYCGGTVHFPAVPAGPHTVKAYLMDSQIDGPGIGQVARDANRPLRIVVNHN